jgi:hypothetical protein
MKPHQIVAITLAFTVAAPLCFAKPKHPQQRKPTQAPAQALAPAPPPPPASALPSVQLQYFFDKHLGNILGPLDTHPPDPSDDLTRLKEGLKDSAAAASPERKAPFHAALGVCDLLQQAMTERAQHSVNLDSAFVHSRDPHLDGRASAVNDALITAKTQWANRSFLLRKLIRIRYAQEREAERTVSSVAKPGT